MSAWQKRANCAGQPLNLFFPTGRESDRKAKALCKGCPVQQDCLNFILEVEEPTARHGIFGGLTQTERNLLFGSGVRTDIAS